MVNPYELPKTDTPQSSIDSSLGPWLFRFSCGLLLMITLNLLRFYSTWHAYGTDGFEQVGFPFVFFERGGISYQNTMHLHWLLADIVIAVATAYYGAHLLRDGSIAAFRRLQNWGFNEGA